MAVVVVRFARRGAPPRAEAARPLVAAARVHARAAAAATAGAVGGVALVLASMAGGPVWVRVALIFAGALIGLVSLAELAAEVLFEAGRPRASGG